ncbi:LysR substrate-binding domain-containing protein [Collimonas humicola]|uniref:LysR substrate-binding domain-containing protein n=1 Tax=Collimonas humicola TaxID=2825886 RepID=UPI001B8D834D|nr:LysR substrate-binding domain-containing protein [Collimonas humicola]
MDLLSLEIFRTVVREGGITRAAEQLHRVQSNVTTRIRQLEQSLGVSLFSRNNKRLVLTPAGETLLGYAERLLNLAVEAREAVQPAVPQGRLRIGSMESTAASRLPLPLARFHQQWPAVQLELCTGPTQQLIDRVRAFTLDAALVAGPLDDPLLAALLLYAEELVLLAPRSHPPISGPDDLQTHTLIAFENGCAYRRHAENWLASGSIPGRRPDRILELGSYHAMLACVAAGAGIALAPRSVLELHNCSESLAIYPIGPAGQIPTYLIRRHDYSSPAFDAFSQILQSEAKQFDSDPN